MNRNSDLKLPWLPLFALGYFACLTFAGAQQTSGMAPAGSSPAAGATRSGLYSIDSSGPERHSMGSLANPMSSKASNPTGSINSRSTWMAGESSTDPAGAILWNTPQANFPGVSASSWNAGTGSFGLGRQQGGIWLESPEVGVHPDIYTSAASSELFSPSEPASNVESGDSFIPLALTPKGTALIKGASLSAPYASHPETGFGIRGVANPFAAQRGVGSVKSPFGSRTGGFGSLGNGSGSQPATLVTPSTGTLNSPADDDTLPLNEGIGSGKNPGSDDLDRTDGTSH